MARTDDAQPDSRPGLDWLVRLRWLAVVGQLVAAIIAREVIEAEMDFGWVLGLIGFTALTNVVLVLVRRVLARRPRLSIAAVMTLDTATLTGLLLASGGPMNPFSIFFIVQVALAGLLLGARGAWSMAVLTSLGFGLLFLLAPEDPHAHHNHGASPLHLQGMWVAYALAASFVAIFVSGIATALRRRERELQHVRERALEAERLAAMSAFSANAAHELGTPLATIALVSAEMATALAQPTDDAARAQLADDARLVRREVERCKDLLRDLAERSGTWAGETPERLTISELINELRERLPLDAARRLDVATLPSGSVVAPRRSLVESVANLVRNALDASGEVVRVVVELDRELHVRVRDRGPGFDASVLARLGEPFVTTKPAGAGLGLGLHLAMSFAEKTGGRLEVKRAHGETEVALTIPAEVTP